MKKVLSLAVILCMVVTMFSALTLTVGALTPAEGDALFDDFSTFGTDAWVGSQQDGLTKESTNNNVFGLPNQLWFDWNGDDAYKNLTYTGEYGGKALIAYFAVDDDVVNSDAFKNSYPEMTNNWAGWSEMYDYYLRTQLRLWAGTSTDSLTLVTPKYVIGGSTPQNGRLAFGVVVDSLPADTTVVRVGTKGRFPSSSWKLRWLGVRVTSDTSYLTDYSYKDLTLEPTPTPAPLDNFVEDWKSMCGHTTGDDHLTDKHLTNDNVGKKYHTISNFYINYNWNTQTQLDGSWFDHRVEGPGWDWFPECYVTYRGNFSGKLLSVIVGCQDSFVNDTAAIESKADWRGIADNIGLSIYAGPSLDNLTKVPATHYRHGTAEALADSGKAVAVDIIVDALPEGTEYIKVAYDSANWKKQILRIEATDQNADYLAKANVEPAVLTPPAPVISNVVKNEGNVTVDITSAGKAAGVLFVAAYDANNNLVGVKSVAVTDASYTDGVASIPVELTVPANATTVKAMFWDSVDTIAPICDSFPITL